MRYYVSVDGETVEVDLSGPRPLLDGVPIDAELVNVPGTPLFRPAVDRVSRTLLASAEGRGRWRVLLDGQVVELDVADERTLAIRAVAGATAKPAPRAILAPMPGLVVRVNVGVGQMVAAGQGVVVVEAMKMENELKAPAPGMVAEIRVSPGQTVEKGTMLIVLE